LIFVGQQLHVPNLPAQGIVPQPPTVSINTPAANESIDPNAPLHVTGESSWTAEGGVLVRALDDLGGVLDERRVSVTRRAQNGTWTWSVDLRLSDVATGTHGTLFAYAPSLVDGSLTTTAVAPVIYGVDSGQPFITIDTPQPYAQLDLTNGVMVTGRGRGLFENNVVVQVLDQTRQTILQQPTTTDAQQPGGEGTWQITLPVNVIGRGILRAYATDPASGAVIASAEVAVTLGDPRSQSNYVVITFPLPGAIVHGNGALQAMAGYAGGVFGDSVYALVLNATGRILFTLPVPVDPETGRWSIATTQPLPIAQDQEVVLQVVATSPSNGEILASDVIPLTIERPTVTGEITYPEPMTLPETAVVKVSVVNTSLADAPAELAVLGEQIVTAPGQFPIPFAVPYNPASVDARASYSVVVRIEDGAGNLLFVTKERYPVITRGQPSEDVEVVVEPA
jgi:putative lipoprotein